MRPCEARGGGARGAKSDGDGGAARELRGRLKREGECTEAESLPIIILPLPPLLLLASVGSNGVTFYLCHENII